MNTRPSSPPKTRPTISSNNVKSHASGFQTGTGVAEDRVEVAERDGQDRVERHQEQQDEPDDARGCERRPEAAGRGLIDQAPAMNFDQASSQIFSPARLSCSSW